MVAERVPLLRVKRAIGEFSAGFHCSHTAVSFDRESAIGCFSESPNFGGSGGNALLFINPRRNTLLAKSFWEKIVDIYR